MMMTRMVESLSAILVGYSLSYLLESVWQSLHSFLSTGTIGTSSQNPQGPALEVDIQDR